MTPADSGSSGSGRLERPTVEVWLAGLDAEPGSVLTPEERDRVRRFRFAEDRERWARARATTRQILSARTGVPAREVAWRDGPHGKPELAGPTRLHFNLSHSGPLLAVALSAAGPVGVDIEVVEPLPDLERVAARVFSEEEWGPARTLGEGERVRYFYRLWTLKEAVLKYLGTGLSLPPTAVALEPVVEGPPFVRSVQTDGWPGDEARAWIFDAGPRLAAGGPGDTGTSAPDAIGAVVWSGGIAREPVLRRWPPRGPRQL